MLRPIPVLENHLWYPILVKIGGCTHVVEMLGSSVNEWNKRNGWLKPHLDVMRWTSV